ncbi:hypothetical protein Tco_0197826 [Tanacetum coccineum]
MFALSEYHRESPAKKRGTVSLTAGGVSRDGVRVRDNKAIVVRSTSIMLPAFVAWLPRLSLSSSVIPIRNVDVLPRSPMLCPLFFLAWSRLLACLVVVHVPQGCAEQRISCSLRPCAGYASCGPVNVRTP